MTAWGSRQWKLCGSRQGEGIALHMSQQTCHLLADLNSRARPDVWPPAAPVPACKPMPLSACHPAPAQVKSRFRQAGWPAANAATKLSEWARQTDMAQRRAAESLPPSREQLAALAVNAWTPPPLLPHMRPECFDWKHYLTNPDLAGLADGPNPAGAAWRNFVSWGLGEARPHRFLC